MTHNSAAVDKCYTVIFAFCEDEVLLRRKTHPEWQDGLWNGLGGKLSPDDFSGEVDDRPALAAAQRKFDQEAGVLVPMDRFTEMITLHFPEAMIHIVHLDLTAAEADRTDTTEAGEVRTYTRDASGEYNRWFTHDEVLALTNEDRIALSEASIEHNDEPPYGVDSALALLDLIYAMIPWWDGTVEDE